MIWTIFALGALHLANADTTPASTSKLVIDTKNVSFTTSSKFTSFTLDSMMVRMNWRLPINFTDPAFINLAKQFAPAVLRIGGTSEDNLTYSMQSVQKNSVGIPAGTLTAGLWDELHEFVNKVGWEVVFGLNALAGWDDTPDHQWDPANALSLIRYTRKRNYNVVGWELGNELNLNNKNGQRVTAEMSAIRFQQLSAAVVDLYGAAGGGTKNSPYIIGPDTTHSATQSYMVPFLQALDKPVLDVLTWHHYYVAGKRGQVHPSSFSNGSFLDSYVQAAKEVSQVAAKIRSTSHAKTSMLLWMGETSGAGGATHGSDNVIGKFVGVFWCADKMGAAAATGHSVVLRQQFTELAKARAGGGVDVTPEFWVTLLWKRFMGTQVLEVGGRADDDIRVYAHRDSGSGLVGVMVLNLHSTERTVQLDLGLGNSALIAHEEFHLTAYPNPADMSSTEVALNGKHLSLGADGSVPPLMGNSSSSDSIVLQPKSVVVLTFRTSALESAANIQV